MNKSEIIKNKNQEKQNENNYWTITNNHYSETAILMATNHQETTQTSRTEHQGVYPRTRSVS